MRNVEKRDILISDEMKEIPFPFPKIGESIGLRYSNANALKEQNINSPGFQPGEEWAKAQIVREQMLKKAIS